MKKIRGPVFETNSSSTHSIFIAGGSLKDTIEPDADLCIRLQGGEFDWEVKDYWDAFSKASYCLTWAKTISNNHEHTKMLKDVIENHTGHKVIFKPFKLWGEDSWGSIDHQSADVCEEAFESKETLAAFIFCEKSLLHTDNDNH